MTPALSANRELSTALKSLTPGDDPAAARRRAGAALSATQIALADVRRLRADTAALRTLVGRARRALELQSSYQELVRVILRRRATDAQLGVLGARSARLVSRLELIEGTFPRASESVGGARRLSAGRPRRSHEYPRPPRDDEARP